MNESYFSRENLNTHFFVYYGNTNDLFADETLYPLTIRQALHRDLKCRGYRRIVYYSYTGGAYFLDEESKRLWHGEEQEEEPKKELFPNKMLKGRLRPALQEEKRESEALQFVVSPAEMLRYTGHFLNDNQIQTAVIFPDGAEAIKEFARLEQGKMLDNFFAAATRAKLSKISNCNVVLFLFNRTRGQAEEDILSGIDRESIRRYLSDASVTTTHIIPPPGKQEIRNMLNYLRLYGLEGNKLTISVSDLGTVSEMLAKRLVYNAVGENTGISPEALLSTDINGTMQYLKKGFIEKNKMLDMDACRRICRRGDDLPAIKRLEQLVGMKALKDAVNGFLELSRKTAASREKAESRFRLAMPGSPETGGAVNLHFVLTGGPGTGKSTAAELLGEIFCDYGLLPVGHTVAVTPGSLKGNVIGASERNVRQAVGQAMGGVLFIDEAYGLADDDVFARAMVTELVAEMEKYRGKFSLVLAGYPDDIDRLLDANAGLRGRFADNRIQLDDYTPEELTEIYVRMAEKKSLALSDGLREIFPRFFENWYYAENRRTWANARKVRNLLESMEKQCQDGVLTAELIPEDLKQYMDLRAEEDAMEQLNSLIGLKNVKTELKKIARSIKFEEQTRPRNYVFAGNPGTGKTTVAEILGKILKGLGVLKSSRVVVAKYDELVSGYVAGTTQKARQVFDSAINGVLLIDEAYRLIPDNFGQGGIDNDYGGAVMNLLLDYTDPGKKIPICFICAGYEDRMKKFLAFNEGLSRRFTMIHFDTYGPEDLLQMLDKMLCKENYTAEEGYLAAALQNFQFNKDLIAEKYNGGYIPLYFEESKDRLFGRLEKTYGTEPVKGSERWLLKEVDAPASLWCPLD